MTWLIISNGQVCKQSKFVLRELMLRCARRNLTFNSAPFCVFQKVELRYFGILLTNLELPLLVISCSS